MARRRWRDDETANPDRWMVSYADFITLLFALFVVMYSISSLNEGKLRVLSETLRARFVAVPRAPEPIQVGTPSPTPAHPLGLDPALPTVFEGQLDPQRHQNMTRLQQVVRQVETEMAPLIADGNMEIRQGKNWIEIEFNTAILFRSGEAQLAQAAQSVLSDLAQLLKTFSNPIQVEGFTDNVPIKTLRFRSNWELSAARAASVVELLSSVGVAPSRMLAVGHGEHRPIADNDSDSGRRRNRRVVLVIPTEKGDRTLIRAP